MKRWYWIAGVFIAVAVFWSQLRQEKPSDQDVAPVLADESDLYIENMLVSRYDKAGQLQYELRSGEVTQYEQQGLSRLVDVSVVNYANLTPIWKIQAKNGEVRRETYDLNKQREVVELSKDVYLSRKLDGGHVLELHTDSIKIFPDAQLVVGESTVTISTPTVKSTAGKFEVSMNDQWLRLYSSDKHRVEITISPDALD